MYSHKFWIAPAFETWGALGIASFGFQTGFLFVDLRIVFSYL